MLIGENVTMFSEKYLFQMKDFLLMKMLSYLHSVPTKSCSHSGRLRLLQQAHDHLVVITTSITMTTITTTRQWQKQSHWQQHGKETEAGPDKWCLVSQSWRR